MFRLSSILNVTSWIVIICTVLLTVWIASFVFSCGVGIVFAHTELILFPMVAHFMERILNNYCRSLKFKRSVSDY